MTQQLQDTANNALVKLINLATDGVNGAIEFSKQQIPDVIHQLLVWNLVKSLLIFGIGVMLILIPIFIGLSILRAYKQKREDTLWLNYCNDLSPMAVVTIFVSFFSLFLGIIISVNNMDWLQIWLAPKVYLIQYAATLLK